MSTWLRFVLVGAVLATMPGCLVFERQRMVLVTPEPGEKVGRVLFLYEGVRATGTEGAEWTDACSDLTALLDGQRFYLGHWMLPVDLKAPAQNESDDERAWRMLYVKHFRLERGTFYRDRDGRLCVCQAGAIPDVPGFLRDLNTQVSGAARAGTLLSGNWVDDAIRSRLLEAADQKHAWWTLEPGRLHFTLPLLPDQASRYKRQLFEVGELNEVVTSLSRALTPQEGDTPPEPAALLQSLRNAQQHVLLWCDNPIGLTQRRDRLTVSFGLGDGAPIELTGPHMVPPSGEARLPDPKLEDFARTLSRPFRPDSDALIRRKFLQGKLD
jgi:hypothetical protein